MSPQAFTYVLANKPRGTIYVGVTSDLIKRVWEHQQGIADGFTKQYGVKLLVHFEAHDDIRDAIAREKQMKNRGRRWKLELIEAHNSAWADLSVGF